MLWQAVALTNAGLGIATALCLVLLGGLARASAQDVGGGPLPVPVDDTSEIRQLLHPRAVAAAQALGLAAATPLAEVSRPDLRPIDFPLRLMPHSRNTLANGISNFVDLDSSSGFGDFACGSRTYDGHGGTDLFITPFSWAMMDAEDVEIVAAAPGTVVLERDGNFDRQCLPPEQLPPDAAANFVAVLQDDGAYAYYYHMKRGTVTPLPVGSRVTAGDHLGFVGSSGRSSGPHLHFELNTGTAGTVGGATTIDPFAGACGAATTLWRNQWEAQSDPRLVSVTTHSAPPVVPSDNCDTTGQAPNYADSFSPGDKVYGLVSLRDQRPGDIATIQFIDPDGEVFAEGPTGAPASGSYEHSYWYRSLTLPAWATGTWRVRAVLNTADRGSFQLERSFFVAPAPASTAIVAAVLPSGRSIVDTSTATLFAAIINAGSATAYDCSIAPETPIAADFVYQTVSPKNVPVGSPNVGVDIPPGAIQTFVVAFTPRLTFESVTQTARSVDVTLHFHCTNADGVSRITGVNNLILSFSPTPVPDIIAIGDTVSHDGVVRIAGPGSTAPFVVATSNAGSAGPITVTPAASSAMSLGLSICQTDPSTGICLSPPTASVSRNFAAGETATWGIFAQATGTIPFDPANSRVSVRYVDADGILRGATSVAVTAP